MKTSAWTISGAIDAKVTAYKDPESDPQTLACITLELGRSRALHLSVSQPLTIREARELAASLQNAATFVEEGP